MIEAIKKTAQLSSCGAYRWMLTRQWDDRPMLVVVMFNPSDADAERDDPTIQILCWIASFNGYGGIVVVNAIPLRSSTPAEAIDMVNTWDTRQDWYQRDALHVNLQIVQNQIERAGAVLIAWGALGDRCGDWMDYVLLEINEALPEGVPLYCLGKTAGGHPKHPMARGKHKVPKDQKFILWEAA